MRGLQKVGNRQIADGAGGTVQLQDGELEPLLVGPAHDRSTWPSDLGIQHKRWVPFVARWLRRRVLGEGHQEDFCVVDPAFDPTLVDVATGGRIARCDHKDREPKPPRCLRRLHLRAVAARRAAGAGVVVEHPIGWELVRVVLARVEQAYRDAVRTVDAAGPVSAHPDALGSALDADLAE
jgi:hypothetical protein